MPPNATSKYDIKMAPEVEPTSAKAKDKEKAKAVGVEVISNIEI